MCKTFFKLGCFILYVATIVSCSTKKNTLETLVTKNAFSVVSINVKQISEKLAKNGIAGKTINDFTNSLADTTFKEVPNILSNDTISGLDLNQPIVLAFAPSEDMDENSSKIYMIAAIKEIDTFKHFLKKMETEVKIEEGNINFVNIKNTVIGFTKKYLVIADKKVAGTYKNGNVSIATKKEWITEALHNTNKNSITGNDDYTNLLIKNNDIKIWVNQEYLMNKSTSETQKFNVVNYLAKDLFAGSSTTSLINFEDGKVSQTMQVYFNKDIASVLKKSSSQTIDASLLQGFAGNDLQGVMAMSVAPQTLFDYITKIKQNKPAEAALAQMGLNTNDVVDIFTGDVIFALADLPTIVNAESFSAQNLNVGMMLKLKDKSKFNKLLSIPAIAKNIKLASTNLYEMTDTDNKYFFALNDNKLLITTNPTAAQNYIIGTATNSFDKSILEQFKNKSGGFYLNMKPLQGIANNFIGGLSGQLKLISGLLSMFQNSKISFGHIKDNYIEAQGELLLTDISHNALAQLLKAGGQNYNAMQNTGINNISAEDKKKFEEEFAK